MSHDKPGTGDEPEGQVSEMAMGDPKEVSIEEPAVGETSGHTGDPEGGVED